MAPGAAVAAVGIVGGMVAAEVVDEIGEFFEGEEERPQERRLPRRESSGQ
ncbi:hypothetical protein [Streptomyces sp. 4N124]